MYLNKVRLAFVLLPTIAVVIIYITASIRGYGRNLSSASVKLPSVVLDGSVGGLGNQLFRYAFAYTLAAQLRTDLYIEVNTTNLLRRTFDSWRREFVLDYFQIPFNAYAHDDGDGQNNKARRVRVEFLPPKSIANIPVHRRFSYTESNYQHRDPVPGDRVLVVDDYFESETFFAPQKWEVVNQFQLNQAKIAQLFYKDEAIREKYMMPLPLTPSYADLLEDIRSSESVAVHFRIGDFTSNDHNVNHVLPFSFQLRAIKLFSTMLVKDKGLKFFVFSDDIDYVKTTVDFSRAFDIENVKENLTFVSAGRSGGGGRDNSLLEFYLMTKCKHFIVPNSTFSWWAAYLSQRPGKKILAACPKNNVSYYDKYENLNVRAYKKMLGTNILYAYPRNWYTLNPFEALYFQ